MKLFALIVAVLLCSSSAQAQYGPGVNPELSNWYSSWTTVQNGRLVRVYTPATIGQCRYDLHVIMANYPPTVTPTGLPFPAYTVTYHPAYREAKHIFDWMWTWPAYRP